VTVAVQIARICARLRAPSPTSRQRITAARRAFSLTFPVTQGCCLSALIVKISCKDNVDRGPWQTQPPIPRREQD